MDKNFNFKRCNEFYREKVFGEKKPKSYIHVGFYT
jgi:hypothetical protein